MSEQGTLLTALLAVQAEAPTLLKDHKATVKSDKGSYTYSYVALDTIVEQIGPILNKHGLVWVTLPTTDERTGQPALSYRLIHAATDQSIQGTMPLLLDKTNAQGLGSAITYARRYSLTAVLNLVADVDDDGHAAGNGAAEREKPYPGAPTGPQLKLLKTLVTEHKPPERTLRAMLDSIGASNVIIGTGWAGTLTKTQASSMIELFKAGSLPDPEATDVPAYDPPQAEPVGDGADLPWEPEPAA